MNSKFINFSFGIILTFLFGYLFIVAKSFFLPLVLAILISALLASLYNKLSRFNVPGFLITPVMILLILGFVWAFYSVILININQISEQAGVYKDKINTLIFSATGFFQQYNINIGDFLNENLLSKIEFGKIFGVLLGSIQNIGSFLFILILYVVFFFSGRKQMVKKIQTLIKNKNKEETIEKISKTLEDYLVYKTLISLGTGFFTFIVLWLFGVHFPLLWGLLAFMLNFIPSIGSFIAVFIIAIFVLFQSFSIGIIISILVLIVGVQILFGNVLEPMLLGDKLRLHPIFILVSVSVGGAIWGIAGMLISVPLLSIINIISKEVKPLNFIHVILKN